MNTIMARRSCAQPNARRRALLIGTGAATVLPGCAWLDRKQRELALRPSPTTAAERARVDAAWRPGDLRYMLSVPAGPGAAGAPHSLALWWMPHTPSPDRPQAGEDAPALLYLHGTFRNLYRNKPKIDALREAGFSVLGVDYRGWGDSTALVPTEDTIMADARSAWSELQRLQPQAGRRVVFGHSMGGAVAVRLASELHHPADYGAVVIESTFSRLPDVAAAAGFWGGVAAALTTLDFDSRSRIGRIDAPLVMLHGSADRTVPVELGRRLRDAAPPDRVTWVEVPGGSHSRLHDEAPDLYRQTMRDLIARLEAPVSPH